MKSRLLSEPAFRFGAPLPLGEEVGQVRELLTPPIGLVSSPVGRGSPLTQLLGDGTLLGGVLLRILARVLDLVVEVVLDAQDGTGDPDCGQHVAVGLTAVAVELGHDLLGLREAEDDRGRSGEVGLLGVETEQPGYEPTDCLEHRTPLLRFALRAW